MMSPLLHLSNIRFCLYVCIFFLCATILVNKDVYIVNEYVYSPKMAAQETQTLNVFRTCDVMASKKAQ